MSFGIQNRGRQGRAADGDTEGYSQGTHMPTDAHKRCINSRQSYPVTSLLMKSALMTWMWKRGFISLATGRTEGAGKPKILHCVTAVNPSNLHVCSHILSSHYTSIQVDNRLTSHNFDNSAASATSPFSLAQDVHASNQGCVARMQSLEVTDCSSDHRPVARHVLAPSALKACFVMWGGLCYFIMAVVLYTGSLFSVVLTYLLSSHCLCWLHHASISRPPREFKWPMHCAWKYIWNIKLQDVFCDETQWNVAAINGWLTFRYQCIGRVDISMWDIKGQFL